VLNLGFENAPGGRAVGRRARPAGREEA